MTTTAENVIRAKEDIDAVFNGAFQRGWDGGYDKGQYDGYADGYKSGQGDGYDDGRRDEYADFWDVFQNNGNRTNYKRAFTYWKDAIFKPRYNIVLRGQNDSIFDSSSITDLKGILDERGLVLDTSEATNLQFMITSSTITRIGTIDTRSCTSIQNLFSYEPSLVYVEKIILKDDGSQTTNDAAFNQLQALEHIEFEGVIGGSLNFKASTRLTKSSIESIVNALTEEITLASGKTLTLSKTAVNNHFTYYIGEGYDPVLPEDPSNPLWQPFIALKVAAGWTISLV